MKTSILILLFALLALSVNAKFKQRHGELKGLQRTFGNLDARLRRQIRNAKIQINNARVRRNKHHAARRRAHTYLKNARRARLAAEVRYNAARKLEEKRLRTFRTAHKVYLNSKANYYRTYRSLTRAIKAWDHERSVIERVRKLLGVNHSKNWHRYVRDRGVRFQGKKHQKYKHVKTVFHQGRKRFLHGRYGYSCKIVYVNSKSGKRKVTCPKGYAISAIKRNRVDSLAGIVAFKCCTVRGSGRVLAKTSNWWASMDRKGLSQCSRGYALNGYWKTSGTNIYNMELAYCQRRSRKATSCYQEKSVWGSFDRPGWSKCKNGYYVTGMWRNTHKGKHAHRLHRIEEFKCCK